MKHVTLFIPNVIAAKLTTRASLSELKSSYVVTEFVEQYLATQPTLEGLEQYKNSEKMNLRMVNRAVDLDDSLVEKVQQLSHDLSDEKHSAGRGLIYRVALAYGFGMRP
jgi:hypothetical protein